MSGFSSSSSASCPSIAYLFWHRVRLSLYFQASCPSIAYLFQHCVRILLIYSSIVSGFSSSSLASCPNIAYLFQRRVQLSLSFPASCQDFPHLPRHRVRASLIFFGIASCFLVSSLALCLDHSSSQASCLGFS